MNSLQFPLATQDWTVGKSRALALQAAQVKSVEALSGALWVTVSGQVVIEALSDESVVRIGQHAESMASNSQTFTRAMYVSVVCPVVRGLRKAADWLDPSPVAARAH